MELLTQLMDVVLHLDQHLQALVASHGAWIYLILFLIVFCETGLVVTPFLPGDSLLFVAGTVAAGDTHVVCNSGLTLGLASFCNQTTGALNFNGDDRLLLYRDTDATGSFSVSDEVLDAFGESAVVPLDIVPPWANLTFQRCNVAAYTGTGTFVLENFYSVAAMDDYAGFGIAPTYAGCP